MNSTFYANRLPRAGGVNACKCSTVKRDNDYCDRECEVLQDLLGNAKS